MDLAIYDLKLHKGRFIATIIGVGLLFTIVLSMNGLYRGNIYEGLSVIKSHQPDLWVVERYRGGPFNEQSTCRSIIITASRPFPAWSRPVPLHLLHRGKSDRGPEPTLQHHRLRCFRRHGRAAEYGGRPDHRARPL